MAIWGKELTYQFNPVLITLFKKALVAPAEGHIKAVARRQTSPVFQLIAPAEGHIKAVARRQTSPVFQLIAPAEGHTRAVKIINTAIDSLKKQP